MTASIDVHELAIIGSGFGGLGAAIVARRHGVDDFVILERADAVGGTWRDNTYPGCACDIPSHLYSFSFAPNPDWSRSYPAQPEIESYLERIADDYRLRSHVRFGFTVATLRWDDEQSFWSIESADGTIIAARSIISATGPLSQPSVPAIAGIDSFEGVMFHSAKWNHAHDLTGRRVGVIGTGASSIQLVPAIAPIADSVSVFQRTPSWVLPRDDRPAPEWRKRLYRSMPMMQRLHRLRIYLRQELLSAAFIGRGRFGAAMSKKVEDAVREQIEAAFDEPAVIESLVPDYRPGCKRILISNDWYPTLARDDVELVSSSITSIVPNGVVTADGIVHELDTLILATGFAVTDFPAPMAIFGRDGVDIVDHWRDGASTDLGLAVSGFPNLWFLAGPGTGLGHNSIVFMIEAQLHSIGQALEHLRGNDLESLELRPEIERASYAELQERVGSTVWASGCSSWYRTDDGRVDTIWPGTTIEYWWRTRRFRPERFVEQRRRFGATVPDR